MGFKIKLPGGLKQVATPTPPQKTAEELAHEARDKLRASKSPEKRATRNGDRQFLATQAVARNSPLPTGGALAIRARKV